MSDRDLGAPTHSLGPGGGFGLFCEYTAVALTAGFILINRRDA